MSISKSQNGFYKILGNFAKFNSGESPVIPTLAEVSTTPITNPGIYGFDTGGFVVEQPGVPLIEKGVVYSLNVNPTVDDLKNIDGSIDTGAFITVITGLTEGTTYYIRAYAINEVGVSYGEELVFIPAATITLPTVTTNSPITNIEQLTATGGGTVTDDGGGTIIARGVTWSVGINPSIGYRPFTEDGAGLGAFTSEITWYLGGYVFYVRAYATNEIGTAYGENVQFTAPDPVLPDIPSTYTATEVTINRARMHGELYGNGASALTASGFVYSNDPNPTLSNGIVMNLGTTPNRVIDANTELIYTPDTLFYFRAFATNSVGTVYGNILTFTTSTQIYFPGVITTTPTDVLTASAVSGGTIYENGEPILTRGIVYGTSPDPTTADTVIQSGSGEGEFVTPITGLLEDTTYYVRAFATSASWGTTYGSQKSFTTAVDEAPQLPTVITNAPTAGTETTETVGGEVQADGGATVTDRGVVYSLNTNPTLSDSVTSDGSGLGTFTSYLSGLTAGTKYYYRAYATNSVGTSYGGEVSFTTVAVPVPVLPTVTTREATDITFNSFISGGIITSDGGAEVTERGVVYSYSSNPDFSDFYKLSGAGSGSYTSYCLTDSVTGSTSVFYRAYAKNSVGVAYGKTLILILDIAPVVGLGYGYLYKPVCTYHPDFAPAGWRVPTYSDLATLVGTVGGASVAGGNLKEVGENHWESPNTGANNSSGFNATAGGLRNSEGTFDTDPSLTKDGSIPSSTPAGAGDPQPIMVKIYYDSAVTSYYSWSLGMTKGFPVRLIKETTSLVHGQTSTVTDIDGNTYPTICIGTQEWTTQNWKCTKLNTGVNMVKVTNGADWVTGGATRLDYCAYNDDENTV